MWVVSGGAGHYLPVFIIGSIGFIFLLKKTLQDSLFKLLWYKS
jgi:hypothetical protein